MSQNKRIKRTALLTWAVLSVGILVSSCATGRGQQEIKAQVALLEAQNRESQRLVVRMDSIITAGAEASTALRGEMRFSLDEVTVQIAQLLENYNQLMVQLDQIAKQKTIVLPPGSSKGAQSNPTTSFSGRQTNDTPQPAVPSHNCDSTYDASFILARQAEYQKAIDGFSLFLAKCPDHENVENARYWIGESYFALEKYSQAISEFDLLLTGSPSSSNASRALYKLARSQQELGKIDEAKASFKKLTDEFPDTFESEQAKRRLEELQ